AGTVRSVTVDVNITNPTSGRGSAYLFGDYIVELISPQGTPVTLHFNPLPCSSLVTNYPNNRLAQIGALDAFKGEAAAGVWTLRATSRNNSVCSGGGPTGPCSSATVNSWTLHVTLETTAACTACVSPTPPEVSAPGSPFLLTLDRDNGTGVVTFTWENQGSASDSYRLYQGNVSALSGVGVTPSNTAPIRCGIVPATTSFVPAAGDLYFLVAGQKGSGIGPLGEATNPLAFPRSANQTCP
ncbi:MAG TPA: proprotein convertase P-domain-containing protein, partial [Candidatus Polarisedimenticolia bacterium]|nr:proprotein convertase P-domain-containing protein [Candidatus Polarisedimenticolia bacterium]